jgi:hypothetical protein
LDVEKIIQALERTTKCQVKTRGFTKGAAESLKAEREFQRFIQVLVADHLS